MKTKKIKILGAFLSGSIFTIILSINIIFISYIQITNKNERLPIGLFIAIMILLLTFQIAIITNIVMRIKEIKTNEEEEASKY